MTSRIALLGTLAILLMQPVATLAQDAPALSPEEVLLNQALAGQYEINPRMASKIAAIQDARAQAARDAAVAAASSSSEAQVATQESSSAPVATTDTSLHAAAGNGASDLSPVELRLVQRFRDQQTLSKYGVNLDQNVADLHGGAPLAPTGSATSILLMTMALAAAVTMLMTKKYGWKLRLW